MKTPTVVINKRLFCSIGDWDIGKGASVKLNIVSKPLALFLRTQYLLDRNCLIGDIECLFSLTDEDFEQMNEKEWWES